MPIVRGRIPRASPSSSARSSKQGLGVPKPGGGSRRPCCSLLSWRWADERGCGCAAEGHAACGGRSGRKHVKLSGNPVLRHDNPAGFDGADSPCPDSIALRRGDDLTIRQLEHHHVAIRREDDADRSRWRSWRQGRGRDNRAWKRWSRRRGRQWHRLWGAPRPVEEGALRGGRRCRSGTGQVDGPGRGSVRLR